MSLTEKIDHWNPASRKLTTDGMSSMSSAAFFLVPDYYGGPFARQFSADAILKIFPDGQLNPKDLEILSVHRDFSGNRHSEFFWPYSVEVVEAQTNTQGLVSPVFQTTVADLLRRQTPATAKEAGDLISKVTRTLTGLGQVYRGPEDPAVGIEIGQSLVFTSRVLREQLAGKSEYPKTPDLLLSAAAQVQLAVPKYTTLTANDCWLGNFAISDKDETVRIFDPLPNLPLANIEDFLAHLQTMDITPPNLRNIYLDFARVSVNLNRFVLEWSKKGWKKESHDMKSTILPEYRRMAIKEIGEDALLAGELANNAFFAICNCTSCTESGALDLSLQETTRLATLILS